MNEAAVVFPREIRWETEGTSRIPFMAYTSEELHRKELERLFYSNHWCYVGLEAEIPNPGDFKRTAVGERSVIMVRDAEGGINVVENVCAHRGMQFCRERHGNRKDFVCPYHQWSYTLKGDLQGVPFRRGVKQDGRVNGGMPADFKLQEHGLNKLKVARREGCHRALDGDLRARDRADCADRQKRIDRLAAEVGSACSGRRKRPHGRQHGGPGSGSVVDGGPQWQACCALRR